MHTRIAARALQFPLVDHDHCLIEHVVQLVLVERCRHDLSVPQQTGTASARMAGCQPAHQADAPRPRSLGSGLALQYRLGHGFSPALIDRCAAGDRLPATA
jgi:transposase